MFFVCLLLFVISAVLIFFVVTERINAINDILDIEWNIYPDLLPEGYSKGKVILQKESVIIKLYDDINILTNEMTACVTFNLGLGRSIKGHFHNTKGIISENCSFAVNYYGLIIINESQEVELMCSN